MIYLVRYAKGRHYTIVKLSINKRHAAKLYKKINIMFTAFNQFEMYEYYKR